jgi:DNA-directed RNA polymerase subunit RPC12/RpoP
MNQDELKARLLAEAEKAIDAMLAEKPEAGTLSLADIERLALKSGAQVEAGILKELGQEESEIESSHEQMCERCGSRMQRRGRSGRQVKTEAGTAQLERTYYVCAGCGASLFPPG